MTEATRAFPSLAGIGDADGVVRVRSLTKRYGRTVAVEDVSFSLEAGTVTGLIGPNGAGKTTTLRRLLGLAEPSSGEALVFGRRYRELDQPACAVGAMLESDDFDPGRSGRDHLRILARAAGVDVGRVDEMLRLVGLSVAAKRAVRGYSLGMRQRLGLAAALLDEPANGLDPSGVDWLRSFLTAFGAGGGTVLVSSHLLAEMAQTVTRVVIISRGRVVADAQIQELTRGRGPLEDAYLALIGESGS